MTPVTPTTLALAALMQLRGVGRRQAIRLLPSRLPDDADVDAEVYLRATKVNHAPDAVAEALSSARAKLADSFEAGIHVLGMHDEGYPIRLRDMPDPPAILYVKGTLTGLGAAKALAVVGTREPTEYGQRAARKLASWATEAGYVVVSGLAHGCDTLGHEGCLDAGGVGIAVMAHGLDKVYPAANRGLAQRLVARGGCLVSEYPLGVTPMRNAFAERDRIQSGLSDAVLVIETDVKGGTMHTVRFAREQQRPLACINHPSKWLGEEKTKGNQAMIADGRATPISTGEALLAFLAGAAKRDDVSRETPHFPSSDQQHVLAL